MANDPEPADYALIKLTHHATLREREQTLGPRRAKRDARPECIAIGHAWIDEPNREGGTICMVCQVVRFP